MAGSVAVDLRVALGLAGAATGAAALDHGMVFGYVKTWRFLCSDLCCSTSRSTRVCASSSRFLHFLSEAIRTKQTAARNTSLGNV